MTRAIEDPFQITTEYSGLSDQMQHENACKSIVFVYFFYFLWLDVHDKYFIASNQFNGYH